jgi:hypothetical protein
MSYGYNLYRNVFDPVTNNGKSGEEMVIILNKALQHIEAKYPIRSSMRDLLKPTTGNLEILLRALLEDAQTHTDWIFHAE